jgi:outer membrane lipoprotein SlyB
MAALVWVMMGIALWHFAIFVPDHFWSGIVGAFIGANLGAVVFGFVVHGLAVPGQNDTDVLNALEAIPGAIAGMAVVYVLGRREKPVDIDRVR